MFAVLLSSMIVAECKPVTATVDDAAIENEMDEGELDIEQLQRVSEGGTKFDWMLKQLNVQV